MPDISVSEGLWRWATGRARGTSRSAAEILLDTLTATRSAQLMGEPNDASHVWDAVRWVGGRNGRIARVQEVAQALQMPVEQVESRMPALVRLGFIEPAVPAGSYRLLD